MNPLHYFTIRGFFPEKEVLIKIKPTGIFPQTIFPALLVTTFLNSSVSSSLSRLLPDMSSCVYDLTQTIPSCWIHFPGEILFIL